MTTDAIAPTDLAAFVESLPDVAACSVAFAQDRWIVAIRSGGAVSAVEYRNLTWEHLGRGTPAPVIVMEDPSTVGEPTMELVERAAAESRSVYTAARDDVEEHVCRIVAAATENAVVGVDDDLFDLGADSLVLIEVSTSVFETYGVQLEMQEVFEAGTPAQVARLIKDRMAD
ncbi:acyl carrier protein [Streptomyces sp. NPDC053755]|uniref:acyl carrier protein n=1 Tax=Streptomyces sp. NPDC053755 TaxID=3155815 RepID=UPI003417F5D4